MCLLTVQQLQRSSTSMLHSTTTFYFTNNSTIYYALCKGSSRIPSLYALVHEIKLIALHLSILLEPVHVPGKVMINQGTDGLSWVCGSALYTWMCPLWPLLLQCLPQF
jgi:hypothetical protein